jgi:hypothetical protein
MTTRSEFWIGTKMADFRQDEKQSLILLTSGLLLLNRLAGFGDVARKWACVPHGKKIAIFIISLMEAMFHRIIYCLDI